MAFNPLLKPEQDEAVRKWLAQQMGQSKPGSPTAGVNGTKGPALPPRPPMPVAGMADGGMIEPDKNEPGLQDASVSDFLLPYLLGKVPMGQSAKAAPMVEDAAGTEMRDLLKRSMSEPAKGYADGGEVTDDADEWLKLPQSVREEGPGPNDPGQTPDADNEKVVDSHPGLQPDDLKGYIQGQQSQLDKWSPDKEAAVMQNVTEGYKKPGYLAAEGVAGLGDAIMQGVSRAGPGQSLNAIMRNKENTIKNTSDQFAHLQEGNTKQMAAKMALQNMDPNSTLNKIMKPGLKSGFQAAFPNMTPEQLETITSNPQLAEKLMPQLVEAEKAKAENEFKKLNLELMAKNAQATQALTAKERETEAKRAQDESDKAILGGSSIPFVGPSHAQKQAALARLTNPSPQSQQSHGIPELGSTFNGQKVLKVTKTK